MQNLPSSESNEEISLREIFTSLWAYKLFIAGTCALCIFFSGYYILNAEKEFTSTAIFRLDQDRATNNLFGGANRGLFNLSGYGGVLSANLLPIDMVAGRIFIEELDQKLNSGIRNK